MSAGLEHLAHEAQTIKTTLGTSEQDKVAELTYRIAQVRTRESGGVLSPKLARAYAELRDVEREGLRSMATDVLKALVLLGFIDAPT